MEEQEKSCEARLNEETRTSESDAFQHANKGATDRCNKRKNWNDNKKCSHSTQMLSDGFGYSKDTLRYRYKGKFQSKQQSYNKTMLCHDSARRRFYRTTQQTGMNNDVKRSEFSNGNLALIQGNDKSKKRKLAGKMMNNIPGGRERHSHDFLNRTYPPYGKRGRPLTDNDLDIDTIIPNDVQDKFISQPPKQVPKDFTDMSVYKQPLPPSSSIFNRIGLHHDKTPDKTSKIYIKHEYADDMNIGDEFGVEVWTNPIKLDDGSYYYRHFFNNVVTDGPADKMKIRNNDELVVLNGIFVPQVKHECLVETFRQVKVDGKTRFKLILRRVEKAVHASKKEWVWIDTSAILSPGWPHDIEHYPKVEEPKFETETGFSKEIPPCIKEYQVPGTQFFLDIRNGMVKVDVKNGTDADKTKRIWKHTRYEVSPNDPMELVHYFGALCDESKRDYISLDHGCAVNLTNEPFWFRFKCTGEKIWFKKNDKFLACNKQTRQIETGSEIFYFSESSPENCLDHPDSSSSAAVLYDRNCYSNSSNSFTNLNHEETPETIETEAPSPTVGFENYEKEGCEMETNCLSSSEYCVHKNAEDTASEMTLNISKNNPFTCGSCVSLKTPTTPLENLTLCKFIN